MNISIENTAPLGRKLVVELGADEIRQEMDSSYNELRRTVQLKGFRQGRAPRKLLERFFGDQVRSDVIQKLVREYTERALAENNLRPVVAPEVVTEEADLDKSLRFTVSFDVRPELVVSNYEGIELADPEIKVSDEEVEAALGRLRERHGTLQKVADRRVVRDGDFVLARLEGRANGEPLANFRVEDRLFAVSSEALAHGLERLFVNAEIGVEARQTMDYPADYRERELAGKSVEWRLTVKEVFRRELPELDDEFARDLGSYANLDELRRATHEHLIEDARQEGQIRLKQGLLDLLAERNPVELPLSLVAAERRAIDAELLAVLEAQGISRERALESLGERAEELQARAERQARNTLILDALVAQEKVEVSDDELADRIVASVREGANARQQRADFYSRPENREALRAAMRREKAFEAIFARVRRPAQTQAASGAEP